jgi:hypothetical protein
MSRLKVFKVFGKLQKLLPKNIIAPSYPRLFSLCLNINKVKYYVIYKYIFINYKRSRLKVSKG